MSPQQQKYVEQPKNVGILILLDDDVNECNTCIWLFIIICDPCKQVQVWQEARPAIPAIAARQWQLRPRCIVRCATALFVETLFALKCFTCGLDDVQNFRFAGDLHFKGVFDGAHAVERTSKEHIRTHSNALSARWSSTDDTGKTICPLCKIDDVCCYTLFVDISYKIII
jgi:hypothetical protein